jgi:hypothetical protein
VVGMYSVSTYSLKIIADPLVTSPWFMGLRSSVAIFLTSRSGIDAGASFLR